MWWRCDSGGRSRWLWTTAARSRAKVLRVLWLAAVPVASPSYRRPCYHGFHVLRDSGVPRVPANGATVDCEQLRQEDDQHVLEHHQFHVSARLRVFFTLFLSLAASRRHGDPRIDHVMLFASAVSHEWESNDYSENFVAILRFAAV